MNNSRITKSLDKKIFGVAAGIAEYLKTDPLYVRLAFVALALMFDYVIVAYLVLAFVLPQPEGASVHEVDIRIGKTGYQKEPQTL